MASRANRIVWYLSTIHHEINAPVEIRCSRQIIALRRLNMQLTVKARVYLLAGVQRFDKIGCRLRIASLGNGG